MVATKKSITKKKRSKNFLYITIVCFLSILIVTGVYIFFFKSTPPTQKVFTISNPRDATYIIEGVPVTLVRGVSTTESAPGSASKVVTTFFGNEVRKDLNGDGKEDVIFILTQSGGGSGLFYYVVVALYTDKGYKGSNAVLLGDRIAPQTTEVTNKKVIVVNYATRTPQESFAVPSSVGTSMYLTFDAKTMSLQKVK